MIQQKQRIIHEQVFYQESQKRLMHRQIRFYIHQFLSPYMCSHRKGFSSQHTLSSLIEKWKKMFYNKGYGEAVLMDL